jgi:hypothetical protein
MIPCMLKSYRLPPEDRHKTRPVAPPEPMVFRKGVVTFIGAGKRLVISAADISLQRVRWLERPMPVT